MSSFRRERYAFDKLLEVAPQIFKDDSDMNAFGQYFETYIKNLSSCAYYYRLCSSININMRLE